MIWNEVKEIAKNVAKYKNDEAGYAGARSDYGAGEILSRVNSFEEKLVVSMDLRPSEHDLCLTKEIGFPYEFSSEIQFWKGMQYFQDNQNYFKRYFD